MSMKEASSEAVTTEPSKLTAAQRIAERLRLADTPFVPEDERMKDMDDSYLLDIDWPPSLRLRAALAYCRKVLEPDYDKANALAIRYQDSHRRTTRRAAYAGGIALLVAIAQLTPWQQYVALK